MSYVCLNKYIIDCSSVDFNRPVYIFMISNVNLVPLISEFIAIIRMPRPKIRPILQYDDKRMQEAIRAVEGGMPKKTAARTFGVPRSTLADKINGKSPHHRKMGRDPFLSAEEEARIVE